MITASHNPAQDNGVKIIENTGHMLDQSLEHISEKLINADGSELEKILKEVIVDMGISKSISENNKGIVLIGRDTRISSESLSKIVMYFYNNNKVKQ